jgi:putative ATP-binding cassette transporter
MTPSSPTFFARFTELLGPVLRAEVRGRLLVLLVVVLGLKLLIVGLNVLDSFLNRFFIDALVQREATAFDRYALLYLAGFAALSIVGALASYTEGILGIRWREWLSRYFFNRYLGDRRYYYLQRHGNIDNPDQRVADDIRTYTSTTLSLTLIVFDAVVSLVSFIGVLWSITPWLVLTAICYTLVGSVITLAVGGRLVLLNNLQLQKEGDFRYSLVRMREHAEAIALLRGEAGERRRLTDRLGRAIENMRHIVAVNRNLQFFVALYGYLNPVIPVLVVAPFYLSGEITDFGAVTQSAVAFPFVLGAFSVLINQFGQISTLAAVTNRLGSLWETLRDSKPRPRVIQDTDDDEVRARDVTILAHENGAILVKDLSLDLPPHGKLLVVGPQGSGKTSLFRALAGLECRGAGHVWRPADAMFLPQRPYTPPGTLRQLLTYTASDRGIPDEKLIAALRAVGFPPVLQGRFQPSDVQPWSDVLSIGEQQQVAFARLLIDPPTFAFLDDALSALDDPDVQRLYELLPGLGIGYVTFSERAVLVPYHDGVLELTGNGFWQLRATEPDLTNRTAAPSSRTA